MILFEVSEARLEAFQKPQDGPSHCIIYRFLKNLIFIVFFLHCLLVPLYVPPPPSSHHTAVQVHASLTTETRALDHFCVLAPLAVGRSLWTPAQDGLKGM